MKYLLLVLGVVLTFRGYSQRCMVKETMPFFNEARKGVQTSSRDTLPGEVIIVPVVIHVLYNTNDQNIPDQHIIDQINSLNRDFRRKNADTVNTPAPFKSVAADSRIVFCIAKTDPDGKSTTGIIRKYTRVKAFFPDDQMKYSSKGGDDTWDPSEYFNIWVCNLFGRTLGYSVMPGGNPALDGVVIQTNVFGNGPYLSAPFNKGRTLTHETGHWLGLKHLWGDSVCGSDGIDDTPPQEGSSTGCPDFPKTSSCSINPYGDMFMDFMDFTDDACMNMFSTGQVREMRSQFAKGGFRNSFLASTVCESSPVEEAPQVPPDGEVDLQMYPNPFATQLIIRGNNFDEVNGKAVRIYNVQGKLVQEITIQSQTTIVNTSQLPSGVYIAIFENANKRKIFKIVKAGYSGNR